MKQNDFKYLEALTSKYNNRNTKERCYMFCNMILALLSLLLTLNIFHTFSSVSILTVEYVLVCWVIVSDITAFGEIAFAIY